MRSSRQFQTSLFFLRENFTHTKSTKSTKTQTSEQATFLPLDVFYAHKNAALYAFFACKIFSQKKIKKFKIALMTSSTILLKSVPKNFLSAYGVMSLFNLNYLCSNLKKTEITIIYAPIQKVLQVNEILIIHKGF